ncbi:hypothetical protein A9Q84_02780 [Halobacteriovorax marinus]|uniref:Transposase IS200-like domain-containing protein n=1 Tax=Halobacteriovorax marinus TaxID=97084 RepID=A0A1Y5FIF9_9BACT|nr:hypothetical protein A9Q84_02780 [Halobacteriovorax marinus]
MTRRKLIRQNKFPYHVTSRTNNKCWFGIPLYAVWDFSIESLKYAIEKVPVEIHCFVLMGNHYHLLLSTPGEDIDQFMRFFNSKLAKLISKKSKTINHRFSNRYKWSIVDNSNYLLNVYRYIYQNPVRAQIIDTCKRYPFSSLNFTDEVSRVLNHRPHINYFEEKEWIEKLCGDDFDSILRKSLKKERFMASNNISTFHRNILDNPKG